MALDPDRLLALEIPEVRQRYTWRDTVLYGLGVGCGLDPTNERELRFVHETRLATLPTMANVLGHPGFWMRDLKTGIDWVRIVHGEQSMQLHRPLAPEGEIVGRNRVIEVVDKGPGKGAIVVVEREIVDEATGERLATLEQSIFCRGDGGCGSRNLRPTARSALPDREPDVTVELPTHPQLALVYRLSGDLNPLHASPEIARQAGFGRPILHGLATFGIAGRALMQVMCDGEPSRVGQLRCRFSAPVFPGESIAVDLWHASLGNCVFRARAAGLDRIVLSNGSFACHP